FTILILSGLTMGANAQNDGKYWLGGSVGFSTYKPKGGDATNAALIAPEVGVNFSDSWGLGLAIGYTHLSVDAGEVTGKGNAFSVNPFVRYTYFKKDLASLFIDGGVAYTTTHVNGLDDNYNEFEVGFRPGVAFNIAPNIKLLGKFGFLGYTNEKFGDSKANSFKLGLDLTQVQLGINILF
ncbi:MAG: porin family protein, partial [Bacteroides sp.]|nr:porin family protein [Bacteroides sp.]